MSKLRLMAAFAAVLWVPACSLGQVPPGSFAESFQSRGAGKSGDDDRSDRADRADRAYEKGQSAIDGRRWEQAVAAFGAVTSGARADGALYWKAYALNKLGRREEALSAIAQLQKSYPSSRWIDDSKALQLEVHQASGQNINVNAEPDEELKLMALNGLMNSDPDRAIPMLEKFLQGHQAPKLQERALFVLAQSDNPKGRQILLQIARGGSNPDLQLKAVHYLGVMGSSENRKVLSELYSSSNDIEIRRAVLHAFMVSGDHEHLLQAAKSEKNPDLRMEAIHQLGISGGQAELWQLYKAESSVDVKEAILHSMFVGGNSTNLLEVAHNEKDVRLRRAAIHSLGLMGGEHTGSALVSMYSTETDPGLRAEIVNALFIQGNAKGMVDLARKESNPELKKMIVSKLSVMGSKDATEYMMEILSK